MRFLLTVLLLVLPFEAIAETELWLVRHAEKEKGVDPALTKVGKSRARMFGHMFEAQGVTRVFSTHTRRTMQTALPTVTKIDGQIEFYDPSKLDEVASMLCALGGKALVVGHSNTTPRLVNAILGRYVYDDHNEADYDSAYRVTCGGDQAPEAHLISIKGAKPDDAHDDKN